MSNKIPVYVSTTGLTPSVYLNDLGERILEHPLINYDLGSEFNYEDLFNSIDFLDSLEYGYLTASYNNVTATNSSGFQYTTVNVGGYGATGPQGIQGATGTTGTTGSQGIPGATGSVFLNGLTSSLQYFGTSSNNNVTLNITSSGSTHSFNLGWDGVLSISRGGLSNSSFVGNQILRANSGVSSIESSGYIFNDGGVGASDIWSANQIINYIGVISGGGIMTLNGLTNSMQSFTVSNDSNVIMNIISSGKTHSYNIGWNGLLPVSRGGLNNSSFTQSQLLITSTNSIVSSGYTINDNSLSSSTIWSSNRIQNYIINEGGLYRLNGLTQSIQTFTVSNDSNIIMDIVSSGSTHSYIMGWSGSLPISRGGHGQITKTAGFDALSPLTTKGDVQGHDGTNNVRVPVGSNGYVLTADSTNTNGVTWSSLVSSGASVTKGVNTGDSNTVVNTIVETGFTQSNSNYIVPANEATNLTVIKSSGFGKFSTKSGTVGTLTLRLKRSGTTICTVVSTPGSAITNTGFSVSSQIQFRSYGATGSATAALKLILDGAGSSANTSFINVTAAPILWDTTVLQDLYLSAQWSSANAANSITLQMIDYTVIK